MGNNLKYTVIVSDSDNHFNPAQLEFIVVYVGSSQVCPVGSFMIENDKEHVLPDDELQKISVGKKVNKVNQQY
jgi:choline kinase